MVQFLFPVSALEKPDFTGSDCADIWVIDAESSSVRALPAVQKQLALACGNKSKAQAGKGQKAAPACALLLPFSLFQGGKAEEKLASIAASAAAQASIALFCFAVPPGAGSGKKAGRTAALWARAAAFAARHDSLSVLPYRPEEGKPRPAAAGLPEENSLIFWLKKARASGFKGILLRCPDLTAVRRAAFMACAGRFVRQAQAAGLRAGIIGVLQAPDIPRLLAFAPDYLGCSASVARQWSEAVSTITDKAAASGPAGGHKAALAAPAASRDKILVSDYVVPVHIGAYAHEKTAAQPVCFNIIAEIARPARPPQAIGEVFSYDIILDAIATQAVAGPVELVETLAEQLAAFLLTFPPVQQVTVRVEKLQLAARAVGVEITRRREQG